MATFEDIWRRARLELPAVPALLLRAWAQDAYNDLCDRWGWAFLRAESSLVTLASRTLSVTFASTNDLTQISGAFVASDAGRQIRVSTGPIYTIASVDPFFGLGVLDRPYAEPSITADALILDAYTTMPADFRRFLVIIDRYNQRIIPFWMTEDELAVADPSRRFSDSFLRYVVARKYSSAAATLGRVQYEYWPALSAARTYPYLYIRAAEPLTDSSTLPGVLSTRSDIFRNYLLARGSLWPGTLDQKNPAFSPQAAQLFQAAYETELQRLTLVDDSEYPQQYQSIHWDRRQQGLAPTATLLRQTDATTNDYY